NPGPGEDAGWLQALARGMSLENLVVGFALSEEYYQKATAGSADPSAAWVRSLYVNLLGRAPDAAEVSAWVGALPTMGRVAMARAFAGSAEFRGVEVRAFYGAAPVSAVWVPDLLKRSTPLSNAEVNGWVNSGLDLLVIEQMILTSAEFANG